MAADDVPGPKKQPRFKGTGAPATAADLNILGNYAALVGNDKVGTNSERLALPTDEQWPGMTFYCTDNKVQWVNDGPSAWSVIGGPPVSGALVGVPSSTTWEIDLFRRGDRAMMQGRAFKNDGGVFGTGTVQGILPAGFRPLVPETYLSLAGLTTGFVWVWVGGYILANGNIQLNMNGAANITTIGFDEESWRRL